MLAINLQYLNSTFVIFFSQVRNIKSVRMLYLFTPR